ncbi:MAG TPA: ThuA domain-containing protein [Methylomirabilota bacterium]|nr:ThuA domain-containing protein [Methylomirabilota bacterium]
MQSRGMPTRCLARACVLALPLLAASAAPLPPREGLVLWLEAGRQAELRQARQWSPLAAGDPVDYWLDGSGHGRDLHQPGAAARPRWEGRGTTAWVRFDGVDDFLSADRLGLRLTNVTVFVLAAPRANAGFFRAFLALSRAGFNDYTSGLTLDLGGAASRRFETLNAEGVGFGGAVDVMTDAFDFGAFHVVSLVCSSGPDGVRTFVDGRAQTARDRQPSSLGADLITVGARHYSNMPEPPHAQGFLDGAVAEVLVYDRALEDAERRAIEESLLAKGSALSRLAQELQRRPGGLVTVSNAPPIQMFLPGFEVTALPVDLPNINNVKYRPDGKLIAVGYNGRVFLLSDSDGDGLEDRVESFWDKDTVRAPIGLALTPPGYALGHGVFLPGKGRLALLVDTNADDRADADISVATWTEPSEQHGVDGLGVAVGPDGSVYFGLGTASFTGAYLIDPATGRARYSLSSERGTILKVAPDFSRREIVCTGIRFSVALAFNRHGDLFCTDQEGATWLPNGNPLDELLHIQPGRHYGFPPRHPRHLPGVIDEPSVFDYEPQHQSTCGLNFNEPVNGGPVFGPARWAGDAFVTGYSRGKLYRTRLVKTAPGYVAANQLLASLNQLTVDACVSPRGDLIVATHSGQPDWGSGPTGQGKLHRVRHANRELPQPLLVAPVSPTETHVIFDRPLDLTRLKDWVRRVRVEGGPFVAAGDRFETFRPGYRVVKEQMSGARFDVQVTSVNVSADRQTVTVATAPRMAAVNYALSLPSWDGRSQISPDGQYPVAELAYDLSGVLAEWQSADGRSTWSGWLPHPDLMVARELTAGSPAHESLWRYLHQAGRLVLRGQLRPDHWLQPAVQPGSTLDYEPAPEVVTVSFQATGGLELKTPDAVVSNSSTRATLTVSNPPPRWVGFDLAMETSPGLAPKLDVHWHTAEDARPRALALRRALLPWARPEADAPAAAATVAPELAGGNWLRGQRVFFGEQAACGKCHQVRGRGGRIGPDLSNLVHRDHASVLKDIRQPSAALNPDHIAYLIELNDGESLTGVLLADRPDEIEIGDASGRAIVIAKRNIRALRPSTVSLMPEGLDVALGSEVMRDLMTFLLTSPLEPAPIETPGEPAPRSWRELEPLLAAGEPVPTAAKPLCILLAAGPKDHGPGEHDYPLWLQRWSRLLSLAENVRVETTMKWPGRAEMDEADVIVFYSNNPGWSAERAAELAAFQRRGGGLVYLHYAVDGHGHVHELSECIGLAWQGGRSKFRHGPLELVFDPEPHPISRGFVRTRFLDESYWNLQGDAGRIRVLARAEEDGQPRPLLWTFERDGGRVFVSILGHYNWTFDDPLFRLLVLRGICWAGRQPVDRLSDLVTVGARIAP